MRLSETRDMEAAKAFFRSAKEPLAHALPLTNVLRADEPSVSFTSPQALANAPQTEHDFFRVPAVLDPGSGA